MAYELNANVAFNVNFDGKALGGFFMGSDLVGKGLYSYFIAAHEMGHSFGLIDLYGGNGASFEFIEDYTIMSHAMRGAGSIEFRFAFSATKCSCSFILASCRFKQL